MTALERAAMAVEEEGPVGCCSIDEGHALRIARAVLMAVREPDEAAILDGERAAWDDTNSMPAIRATPKAWRDMIDAILNEKDTTND